jgi:hypothetical protein
LDASNFLAMIMFSNQPFGQVSLEDMANDFCEQNGIPISKQAIQERFNDHAVIFMQALLKEQLSRQLPVLEKDGIYKPFNRIRIKDSTRYSLPKEYASIYKGHGGIGGAAQISIQYEYDLLNNEIMSLDLTSACVNDQQDSRDSLHTIRKNDLLIRDLGYSTQGYIKHITNTEAFYINRLNPLWKIYDIQNQPIDFVKVSRKIKRYSLTSLDRDIFIRIGSELIPSRLMISPVDEKTYRQRIKKAKKKGMSLGYTLTEQYKASASMNLFITNIPKARLATEEIKTLYRLRWQVELIFKVWKSQANIDKIKSVKIQRFQCELIARLLWLLLHWQVLRAIQPLVKVRCSIWKFYKVAFRLSAHLKEVFQGQKTVRGWFEKLIRLATKKYRTEFKKGKNDSFSVISLSLA